MASEKRKALPGSHTRQAQAGWGASPRARRGSMNGHEIPRTLVTKALRHLSPGGRACTSTIGMDLRREGSYRHFSI